MAQNDLPQKSILDKIIYISIALAVVALIGFKCYDYYQVIQLRQPQIELTEHEKAAQDSVMAFVERGKMACRVCKDCENNNPNRITDGQAALISIGLILFVGGIFAWAFWNSY
jgi:predicted negative regulator of RcsB-dependent stress response